MLGNIIFGGGIGAIIDHNQGTAYEYPTLLQIILGAVTKIEVTPTEAGAQPTAESTAVVGAAAPQIETASPTPVATAGSQSETYRKLKELDALHKEGVLTQQEFEEKKQKFLRGYDGSETTDPAARGATNLVRAPRNPFKPASAAQTRRSCPARRLMQAHLVAAG